MARNGRWMRSGVASACVVGAVLMWGGGRAAVAGAPAGETRGEERREVEQWGKLAVIRVDGDLVGCKLAKDFGTAVERAMALGARTVIVELDGERWRADVVAEMAGSLRGAASDGRPVRVVVYLDKAAPTRGSVGGGALALAMVADEAWAHPGTLLSASAGQEETETPDGVDVAAARQSVRAMVDAGASERGESAMLAGAIPAPDTALWWVQRDPWEGARAVVTDQNPSAGGGSTEFGHGLIAGPAGSGPETLRLEVTCATAERIGLVRASGKSVREALAARRAQGRTVSSVTIACTLEKERRTLHETVSGVEEAIEKAESAMRDVRYLRSNETLSRRRSVGKGCLKDLEELEGRIAAAERVAQENPELLMDVPPGRTPVGQEVESRKRLWTLLFQNLRDDLDDAISEARRLAEARAN